MQTFQVVLQILLQTLLTSQALDEECINYVTPVKEPKQQGFQSVIVGGLPALHNEFPYMVALGYGPDNRIQWLCGGTLISRQHVLTAAHCLVTRDLGKVRKALLGTINLASDEIGNHRQTFNVKTSTQHPDYKTSSKYHDIAIVHLDKQLMAMGWGKTQFTGFTSTNLIKVDLVTFNNSYCNEFYDIDRILDKGIVDDMQLCAGGRDNQVKDTCQGDSGGPLIFNLMKRHYVAGITSFGVGCGIGNTPGVYTRVSKYIKWIESVVGK